MSEWSGIIVEGLYQCAIDVQRVSSGSSVAGLIPEKSELVISVRKKTIVSTSSEPVDW